VIDGGEEGRCSCSVAFSGVPHSLTAGADKRCKSKTVVKQTRFQAVCSAEAERSAPHEESRREASSSIIAKQICNTSATGR
jgi:hypothetical protein